MNYSLDPDTRMVGTQGKEYGQCRDKRRQMVLSQRDLVTVGRNVPDSRLDRVRANGKASGNKVGSVDEVVYKRQQEKSCVGSGKVSEWVGRPEVSVPAGALLGRRLQYEVIALAYRERC